MEYPTFVVEIQKLFEVRSTVIYGGEYHYISNFKTHIIEFKNQHDLLTNLPLRKLMFKKINDLKKNNKDFYLAFLDIDYFKKINDLMGYEKGDEALILTSNIIYKKAGKKNLYRYGGEEFVMIIEEDDINRITNIMESIYKDIRDLIIQTKDFSINITLTTGITKADVSKSPIEIISKSSELMQLAKKEGRDRYYFLNND